MHGGPVNRDGGGSMTMSAAYYSMSCASWPRHEPRGAVPDGHVDSYRVSLRQTSKCRPQTAIQRTQTADGDRQQSSSST